MDIRQVINDAVPVGVVGVGAVTLMGKASTVMYGQQSDEAKQEDYWESYGVAYNAAANRTLAPATPTRSA